MKGAGRVPRSLPMSTSHVPKLTPAARRQEIAAILAKGVVRWHQRARPVGLIDPENPPKIPENGLEFPAETRPCVAGDTRGLWPRDDGDNA